MSRFPLPLGMALIAIAPPAASQAQTPVAGLGTRTLSEAEKAEILDHGTEDSVANARSGLGAASDPSPRIHGVMGVTVGSHGYRSVYGAATVPLGDRAAAAVSFEDSRFNPRR